MKPLCFDSVTLVPPTLRGKAVLAASHGGTYVADVALRLGLGGLIVSDAGIGRERAGVAGLDRLERHGVPAAAVSVHSAPIGDGSACFMRGVISVVNGTARSIGIKGGMGAREALAMLSQDPQELVGPTPELNGDHREVRETIGSGVVVINSNSMVASSDESSIVVTGSHGGLLGGRADTAVKWPVVAAIYNDAGGGIDGAGYSRLPALDVQSIPAATVSTWSARIGDGRSTLDDGYVTHINACAEAVGAEIGISCKELVARLVEWKQKRS